MPLKPLMPKLSTPSPDTRCPIPLQFRFRALVFEFGDILIDPYGPLAKPFSMWARGQDEPFPGLPCVAFSLGGIAGASQSFMEPGTGRVYRGAGKMLGGFRASKGFC